ncbi:MAG: tRNA preQ1(34) S-adenosylmethionine ribosyltransferase-isomerase QueA [Treponema sp.]|jgi:S-adenosylmethionine:tRNA ribosyltransferase-isomerase|nr:tRNA preQ1(34) S-adenosylmethionine ribosyltransferase-isomerase QueA [Treponema sp.]
MKTKDFYFDLPESLIAQHPSVERGNDKLMKLDRYSGKTEDFMMENLPDLIKSGTVMVFNNSRVRRSRLYAMPIANENLPKGAEQSSKEVEFLILENLDFKNFAPRTVWKSMTRNAKKQKAGKQFRFNDGSVAKIIENPQDDFTEFRTLLFDHALDENWFERNGHIPLPPYIKREDIDEDAERYQTIYAKETGSAAAPTAGLHFTEKMLERLKAKNIEIVYVTLHVGLGTFLPVRTNNIEDHKMHKEHFFVSDKTAYTIEKAKKEKKPVLAVGTTSLRTLESAWNAEKNILKRGEQDTSIFIYPGYEFKVVDSLFTNFHTPESTLMMLVSAFAGKDNIMAAYKKAVQHNYRFFSYGDAMLISKN